MRTRSFVAAIALIVLLAGCLGGIGGGGDQTSESPTDAPTDATEEPTATSPPTATTGDGTPTGTDEAVTTFPETTTAVPTTQPYQEPIQPNRPFQTNESRPNHIDNVEILNKVDEDGDGAVSAFSVKVSGNTSWMHIDPPDKGDAKGEPFILVRVNGELVERSDYTDFSEEMTYTVDVHPGGLKQFDDGELDIEVLLMDQDKTYDDVYGSWTGTIEYEQEEDTGGNESVVLTA
ncbi:hypothetical protein [Haloarchaeobius sp. DFWS5]|uniref:hypothetical protein n=1 Tax=Haloarchaeobius sp. DFWS5 TaxID=3446114 RepID=UPI003EB6CA8F